MLTKNMKVLFIGLLLSMMMVLTTGIAFAQDDEGEDEDAENEEEEDDGERCSEEGDSEHPVATSIAETYDVEYAQVMEWYCEGFGFGEIMLALETGQITDLEPGDFLEQKGEGKGWGLLWQELGLIGKEGDGGPPQNARANREKARGNSGNNGNGNGNNGNGNGNGNSGDGEDADNGNGNGNSGGNDNGNGGGGNDGGNGNSGNDNGNGGGKGKGKGGGGDDSGDDSDDS